MTNTLSISEKVIVAKALRTSFCAIQGDMLKTSYMSDKYLVEQIKKAQEDYKIFDLLTNEIKLSDVNLYEKEILGLI